MELRLSCTNPSNSSLDKVNHYWNDLDDYRYSVAWWCHRETSIWINIGSGNGLLPDSTKPLVKPMSTSHRWALVAFGWGQFLRYLSSKSLKITHFKSQPHLPGASELMQMKWLIHALKSILVLVICTSKKNYAIEIAKLQIYSIILQTCIEPIHVFHYYKLGEIKNKAYILFHGKTEVSSCALVVTYWGRDKMATFLQTKFSFTEWKFFYFD